MNQLFQVNEKWHGDTCLKVLKVDEQCQKYLFLRSDRKKIVVKYCDLPDDSPLLFRGHLVEMQLYRCPVQNQDAFLIPYIVNSIDTTVIKGQKLHFVERLYVGGKSLREILGSGFTYTWQHAWRIIYHLSVAYFNILDKGVILTDVSADDIVMRGKFSDNVHFVGFDKIRPRNMSDQRREFNDGIFKLGCLFYEMVSGKKPFADGGIPLTQGLMPQLASEVFQQMTSLDMMKRPGNEHDMEMLNRQMVALQDMIQKNPALEFMPYEHGDEDELSFSDDIDNLFSDEPDGSTTKQQTGKLHRNYDTIMETQFDFKKAERREGKLFGFDAVAGMDGLKNTLRDEVLLPLRNQEAREKYGLQAINGMLLYGPPGNGKTYIAERFAEEADMNYCFIKSSDLSSSFTHGSQQLIAQLFNQAEEHKPCILCIDEIDAILGDRTRMTWSGYAMEVNEMLSQMNNCSERGIFVIATTNNLDLLDPAALRAGRLDEKIYVPLPDEEARKGIFKLNLQKAWTDGSIDFSRLASLTKDYVSADITLIANRAKLLAFKRQCPISQAILEKAISTVGPSLTTSQIKLYEKISYGKRVRPQIGFVTN